MRHKSLWKVSVTTTPEAEDAVAELLSFTFGLPAPVYTDIETGTTTVTVYLQQKPHLPRESRKGILTGLKRIQRCGLIIGSGKIAIVKMRPEDWAESWKRHFKPIKIGGSLLIKPSWSRQKPRKGQAVVVLDPGLSFGTGQHPTTSFCLRQIVTVACGGRRRHSQSTVAQNILLAPQGTWAERVNSGRNAPPRRGPPLRTMEKREKNQLSRGFGVAPANRCCLKPPSFLDLGTGSGILAIAAAKLGYSPVVAMDFDPEAVRVARANACANQVEPEIQILHRDVLELPIRPGQRGQGYDLVCANLISDLLVGERRRILGQLKRTGTLVLAGILKTEFAAVKSAYKALGLSLVSRREEKEWCSGSFRFTG
jgi:ribosomal protein L11 methylase PrmA